jgi:hypothetical protein
MVRQKLAPHEMPQDSSSVAYEAQAGGQFFARPASDAVSQQAQAVLKQEVPGFAVIRRLAIRFQSLLRRRDEKKLEPWLTDAKGCGIPAVMNFARTLMVDIQAVWAGERRVALCPDASPPRS